VDFFPSIGHHPAAGKGHTLPISYSFPHHATHHFPLPVSGPVGGGGGNLPPCRRLWPSDGESMVWESSHRVGRNVEPRKSVTLLIQHPCVYETTPSTNLFLGSKLPSLIRLRHSRMRHLGSPFFVVLTRWFMLAFLLHLCYVYHSPTFCFEFVPIPIP
jgi:hypothetical protein